MEGAVPLPVLLSVEAVDEKRTHGQGSRATQGVEYWSEPVSVRASSHPPRLTHARAGGSRSSTVIAVRVCVSYGRHNASFASVHRFLGAGWWKRRYSLSSKWCLLVAEP
jgi:hypothetical protein